MIDYYAGLFPEFQHVKINNEIKIPGIAYVISGTSGIAGYGWFP